MPTVDLPDDELAAVTAAIRGVIEGDRYPHAPRLDRIHCARRWRGSTRRRPIRERHTAGHDKRVQVWFPNLKAPQSQIRTRRPRRQPKPTSGRGD
jgi:hypothetical protein